LQRRIVCTTVYQRSDSSETLRSIPNYGQRLTNDATVVESLTAVHRFADSLPTRRMQENALQPATARATFHQRRDCGRDRFSGASNRLQYPILGMICYQRRSCIKERCSGTSLGRNFTNDEIVERIDCSSASSAERFTNDATEVILRTNPKYERYFTNDVILVESVTIATNAVKCFAVCHDPCDVSPSTRLWWNPLRPCTVSKTTHQRGDWSKMLCSVP
jgi:hypothetical protein